VTEVVSFRPTPEELEAIERARRSMALESRTEAVRYLLQRGARSLGKLSEEPVFRVRSKVKWKGDLTSRAIDDLLYGGQE
jgi:hypothetical protein